MRTIEEIAFTVNEEKCTYKIYKYQEVAVRKIKDPNGKYVDAKVKITKYALHQVFENKKEMRDVLVCETEMYATILTILKGILTEYIKTIDKMQTPSL